MSDRMILRSALVGIGLATLHLTIGQAQQWTVSMRAMQNPIQVGQCTAIEVVVKDASGGTPVRPDGKQVDWQDFDLSLTTTAPDALAWSNEAHRFLCARAPTAASALVVAYYPARHLTPAEVVPGMKVQQTIEVALQGAGQPASSGAAPNGSYQQPPVAATSSAPGQAAPTPGQPYMPPPAATPASTGVQPAAGAPTPTTGNPAVAYTTSTGPTTPPSPVAAPAAPTSVAAAPTPLPNAAPAAPAQIQNEKKGGGFFSKLGKHLKEKAGEVTSQTAANLATSANQVVDATAQSGSNLVSGAAAQVTSVAQTTVGGVSSSLMPSALGGGVNADNLAMAVQSGQAELRMMRFIGNTEVLDPTGRELVKRLAAVLNATPGNFLIQAHVDPLPSPAEAGASQVLSEHRAAVVKAALISNGVGEARLKALGYGTSSPKPEVPPEGGPPSSARVEIWKVQ